METNRLQQILTYFRNITLNAVGAKRDLLQLLADGDVGTAISRMQDHDIEVDFAVKEYNPETHEVNWREDKYVKGERPYRTEKLSRTRQRYINEVELFFLLGNPIEWEKKEGDDEAFALFTDYLSQIHFNAKIRECKRLAGAETESAFCFHFYQDGGKVQAIPYVAARSKGYKLREMFDQYGRLTAGAVGYTISNNGLSEEHWDVFTENTNFYCSRRGLGWDVQPYPNPTGKINMVYFRQPKAWDGAERRIEREEMLDSRIGDTNNYFADPIAAATADVINSMPKRNKVGKLIQLTGTNSKFEYINPPQNSEIRRSEKEDLANSILFDTFTPDMSSEAMRSVATLTSVGIKRALVLGYIKRANRMEIYEEMIGRLRNVIVSVLKELHPEYATRLDKLEIGFSFAEPFTDDRKEMWSSIGNLYGQGVISLETAVQLLALTDAPVEEVQRIKDANEKAKERNEEQ